MSGLRTVADTGGEASASVVDSRQQAMQGNVRRNCPTKEVYDFDEYLDKIKVTTEVIDIDSGDLTSFLCDHVYFHPCSFHDKAVFQTFLKDMSDAIHFDVEDAVIHMPRSPASQNHSHTRYQYGGYGSTCSREDRMKRDSVVYEIEEVNACFLNLECLVNEYRRKNTDFLISNYVFAMEFVRETVEMLLNPTDMQERAFEHLFYTFGRMVGLQIKDAACEAPRDVRLLGEPVTGTPSMHVHVPWDNEHWWRQRPVKNDTYNVTTKQPVSAIVQVKVSPPEDADGSVLKQVEPVLGQVVENMLAELLSPEPVVDKGRLTMLAIIVLSTKVFFVILEIPPELMSLYKQLPSVAWDQWDQKKGKVYVTNSLDFMKHTERQALIQILHKIGTISAVL